MTARTPDGLLFAVVGPSGAGKDSVINMARATFERDARILFVRRVISRPADATAEDHEPVTEAEFAIREAAGAFCVVWRAHGLCYGIETSALNHVRSGGIAIVNGSRQALGGVLSCFPDVQVVEVSAAPEVIAARLRARGRETTAEVTRRLRRSADAYPGAAGAIRIDNSGDLAVAGRQLTTLIRRALARGAKPAADH